jgi:hypothetical protein
MNIRLTLRKLSQWFFAILILAVILMGVSSITTGKSVERAEAFMRPGYRSSDMPARVKISIDGIHAVFRWGDGSYDELTNLLHKDWETSGQYRFHGNGPLCGEMVISSLGIPSHFPIYHESDNKNIYWIWLPCPSGRYGEVFTANARVIALIKANSSQ